MLYGLLKIENRNDMTGYVGALEIVEDGLATIITARNNARWRDGGRSPAFHRLARTYIFPPLRLCIFIPEQLIDGEYSHLLQTKLHRSRTCQTLETID